MTDGEMVCRDCWKYVRRARPNTHTHAHTHTVTLHSLLRNWLPCYSTILSSWLRTTLVSGAPLHSSHSTHSTHPHTPHPHTPHLHLIRTLCLTTDQSVRDVVITVPSFYSQAQRRAVLQWVQGQTSVSHVPRLLFTEWENSIVLVPKFWNHCDVTSTGLCIQKCSGNSKLWYSLLVLLSKDRKPSLYAAARVARSWPDQHPFR